MESLVSMAQENPAAVAFGAVALSCQLIWPLFRGRRAIMTAQFCMGADYSLHYALLEAWSGAGVAGIGATQSILAAVAGDHPRLRYAGFVFLPVVTVICAVTWSGPASLFALVAVTLIMVGRMQRDTIKVRIMLLAAAPFGMGYDIVVGSMPGLTGGIVSATIAATMLVREIRQRRARPARVQSS